MSQAKKDNGINLKTVMSRQGVRMLSFESSEYYMWNKCFETFSEIHLRVRKCGIRGKDKIIRNSKKMNISQSAAHHPARFVESAFNHRVMKN